MIIKLSYIRTIGIIWCGRYQTVLVGWKFEDATCAQKPENDMTLRICSDSTVQARILCVDTKMHAFIPEKPKFPAALFSDESIQKFIRQTTPNIVPDPHAVPSIAHTRTRLVVTCRQTQTVALTRQYHVNLMLYGVRASRCRQENGSPFRLIDWLTRFIFFFNTW